MILGSRACFPLINIFLPPMFYPPNCIALNIIFGNNSVIADEGIATVPKCGERFFFKTYVVKTNIHAPPHRGHEKIV